jgi:hypothetical protein
MMVRRLSSAELTEEIGNSNGNAEEVLNRTETVKGDVGIVSTAKSHIYLTMSTGSMTDSRSLAAASTLIRERKR